MASLFFLLFLLFSTATSSDITLLLEKIKPSLQGSSLSSPNLQLSSWNSSLPLCKWRGLQWSFANGSLLSCARHSNNLSPSRDPSLQLLSIHLPASALSGSIPKEIAELSSLQSLLLGVNNLTGPIPFELGNSPLLSELDLSGNGITGSLPVSVWNLCAQLTSLTLHGNRLSASIPTPPVPNPACPNLKVLNLGENELDGEFPEFVTRFVTLQDLDLSSNRLSGSIPNSILNLTSLQRLNLSNNNFTGIVPASLGAKFGAEALEGNSPGLCGLPLKQCGVSTSGLSSGTIAGIVIGLMAGVVVLASVFIGWYQGRKRKNVGRRIEEDEMEIEEENCGEGKLMVFQGGEHLTLEDVLNATGQVMEKTIYGTVYKAKLADGGTIALRLLREGSCMDLASCLPVVRQLGRARHENLVPLRAFYQGKRGEKLMIYDYLHNRPLHDLLHGK